MYDRKVIGEIRQVRYEAERPELLDRLVRVLDEQRGHSLAMEVEGAKITLSEKPKSSIALDWIEKGLEAGVRRKDLVNHTQRLADRIEARIDICLKQAEKRSRRNYRQRGRSMAIPSGRSARG
jgi:hypothetical chaperone protein